MSVAFGIKFDEVDGQIGVEFFLLYKQIQTVGTSFLTLEFEPEADS
jgi:hypothetical protein